VGFLTFEEKDLFLEAIDAEWKPMVFTALNTGMRIGELNALKWSDVDFVRNTISVERADWKGIIGLPKNGHPRIRPMNKALREVLLDYRQQCQSKDFVFCSKDGSMLKYGEVRWPIWRACDKVEHERFGWHMFRHTFASHLVMLGVGLRQVQGKRSPYGVLDSACAAPFLSRSTSERSD
jgi:integrase